jgi:hypothetical protein
MLGRFVCPAERLKEVSPFVNECTHFPVRFAVLGKGGSTIKEFLQGTVDDLNAILGFYHEHGDKVAIETYEARLPSEVLAAGRERDANAAVHGPGALLMKSGRAAVSAFYEIAAEPKWFEKLPFLTSSLVQDPNRMAGFKLRCGGANASAVPSVDDVSFAITACSLSKAPIKFTAGLHHPLRHFSRELNCQMHGFFNVFVAGVFAYAKGLNEDEIASILTDEDPLNFAFDDAGLSWGNYRASLQEIATARRWATSFGSCSFDEPMDDLRALGLL